jgi:hypothetical protein
LIGALAAVLGAGCAETHKLDGLSCPCADGYVCRERDQTCVSSASAPPLGAAGGADGDMTPSESPHCTRNSPACTQSEQGVTDRYASRDAAAAALVGRWLMCEGQVFEGSVIPDDFMGYEYRADGTWSELARNAAGDCEPAMGFGKEGTWTLTGSDGGMFRVQVDIPGDGGAGEIFFLASSAQPRKLDYLPRLRHPVADPQ